MINIVEKFLRNTRKPQGVLGKMMLCSMNIGHQPLAKWGLSHLNIEGKHKVLDIGCGGGKNIKTMLKLACQGRVDGIDYSEVSVGKSLKFNEDAVSERRCEILQGSVSKLPFGDGTYDTATAFETIFFWPDIVNDMREVRRVLKPGGKFLICNAIRKNEDKPHEYDNYLNYIEMNLYSTSEIRSAFEDAGFNDIKDFTFGKKGWVCVVARRTE